MSTAIVWLRQDLRLADNPALWHAVNDCQWVIPIFIHETNGNSGLKQIESRASHVYLQHSLRNLANTFAKKGARLMIRQGNPQNVLTTLCQQTQATHIYWNRRYDPISLEGEKALKQGLQAHYTVKSFAANLFYEPWEITKKDGTAYRVFTPFWKTLLKKGLNQQTPLPAPQSIPQPTILPNSLDLADVTYLPTHTWQDNIMKHWQAGEATAQQTLEDFLYHHPHDYALDRDYPAKPASSRLSAALHWGEISPRHIAYHCYQAMHQAAISETNTLAFLREVAWREFAYYLLYHFPQTINQPLDQRFIAFQWREDYQDDLHKWQTAHTGFPIIDAGMRELWHSGWMHNRVRMIVASFLVKNLLIPWQIGEQWFRDTLVDADLANNVLGWQWVAGCGADAAPYFRIFNPCLQSKKFDANGDYIRRWLPELADCPNQYLHQANHGEIPHYPQAMVDLKSSRQRALAHFERIKTTKATE